MQSLHFLCYKRTMFKVTSVLIRKITLCMAVTVSW